MIRQWKATVLENETKNNKRSTPRRRIINRLIAGAKGVDVVVVGAGPVGLFVAFQLKRRLPSLTVWILEKRPRERATVRTNTVKIDPASLVTNLGKVVTKKLNRAMGGVTPIRTIQKELTKMAKDAGVTIQYGYEVQTPGQIHREFPGAKFVIGADGRRSIVRKTIFEDTYSQNTTLQYTMQVSYKVTNSPAKRLEKDAGVQGYYRYLKLLQNTKGVNHAFQEITSKKDPSVVQLWLSILKQEYDILTKDLNVSVHNEINVYDKAFKAKLPLLQKSIENIVKERRAFFHENIELPPTVRPINLDLYQAKDVVRQRRGKTWVLVGDSSFGLPYLRACNVGLLCATQLSKSIVSEYLKVCKDCGQKNVRHHSSGCVHNGAWHSQYEDCGVMCAVRLGFSGLGSAHWTCCYSTEKGKKLQKNKFVGCPRRKHNIEGVRMNSYQDFVSRTTRKESDYAFYTTKKKKLLVWANSLIRNTKRRVSGNVEN